jgi:hypothetical protein
LKISIDIDAGTFAPTGWMTIQAGGDGMVHAEIIGQNTYHG